MQLIFIAYVFSLITGFSEGRLGASSIFNPLSYFYCLRVSLIVGFAEPLSAVNVVVAFACNIVLFECFRLSRLFSIRC